MLAAQTIAATGTLYNYATASSVGVVNLGAHHVGDAISGAVSITNIGAVDAFTEELDVSLGGASTGAFANGSIAKLAPGYTNSLNLSVGLNSTTEGSHSGTATLTLASDGAYVDGLAKTTLAAQTVTIAASVYNYAAPIESATTLDFGAMRIGGATATRTLTISNGTSADAFRENLGYALGSAPSGFALTTNSSGTLVAGAAGASVTFSAGATAGNFNSTDTLTLTSLGAGTSGLANTALGTQAITLKAKEYAAAVAKIQFATVDFGVEHVGDLVTIGDGISNIGTGALVDSLIGGVGTISSSQFTSVGNLGTGVVPGPTSAAIGFQLKTNATGVFTATASLALSSHDADLADVGVAAGPITLIGTVDNYATAALEEVSGGGVFSQVGNAYTLDLGTVAAGGTAPTVHLGALNAAAGLADVLSGSFVISGSGAFINSGTAAFGGLGAGQADTAPTVSLSTTNTGTFTETITLTGTGSNASGYSGTLAPEVLTVIGTVVSSARDLVWTGAAGTDFGNAGNWDDTTFGLDPAAFGPAAIDAVAFNGIGGGITGAGTVASLSIDGGGAWHVASGATLSATGSAVVGASQSGVLLIDEASRVNDGGGAVIAAAAGSGGSSANVTGANSLWQIAGALIVGNAASGSLNISSGGAVSAASLDAAAQSTGNGIIAVTGTASSLTLTGSLTLGDQSAGELSILGGATVSAGSLTVGNLNAASSGNVDVEGAGSILQIGSTGVLNVGVSGGGSGVLTIGQGSTLQFSGGIVEAGRASVNNNGGVIDPDFIEFTTASNAGLGENDYSLYVGNIGAVQVTSGTGTWNTPMLLTGTSVADADNNINNNGDVGEWQLSNSGTLIVNANTVDAGQAIVFEDATDTLVIGQVVNGGSAGISGVTPTIAAGAENLLAAGGFAATIWGYQSGDKVLFDNLAVVSDSIVGGNTLDLFGSGNAFLGSLTFLTKAGNHALGSTAMNAAAAQIACFAAGTRIRTARGEVAVEDLRTGDLAVTALDGSAAAVVWIGHRTVDCRRHPQPASVWPVRIAAGAFGRGLPRRALTLVAGSRGVCERGAGAGEAAGERDDDPAGEGGTGDVLPRGAAAA